MFNMSATGVPTVSLNTGKKMPVLAFGTWNPSGMPRSINSDEEIIQLVINANGRHVDTAYIYGNEEAVGNAIKCAINSGSVRREDLFIGTKLWCTGHSRVGVASEFQRSLQKLQLEYVDLYLIHAPWTFKPGSPPFKQLNPENIQGWNAVTFQETWQAMEYLYDQGLAKAIGVSNFTVKKLEELLQYARIIPAVNQVESHPYLQQSHLFEYCQSKGIIFSAFSPLGSPKRGPNNRRDDDPVLLDDPVVCDIARQHKLFPAQVLIQWALQRGSAVITKASTREGVDQAIQACKVQLSVDDVSPLNNLERGLRYLQMQVFCGQGETLLDIWDE